ncbi:Ger(x)C family spore germination protein [Neobacillus pocheonensis]|uniref:Ger(x)C family spore germination protein n=1 Tax=Neobacillus pocheonensis TaxID=363869 RepID=UPI003D29DBDF
MKKYSLLSICILILVPLLTACWNQKELTDLAFVMAIGVDKGEDKKFDVSFQLVNPGNVSSGQSGGGQGLPIAVYKSSGNTITEAARKATKKVSRRLYYAHTNLFVVSEEVAREDVLELIDALDRDPEFRTTTEFVIARGITAEELVSTITVLDKLPVNKITKELKSTESMLGENMMVNVDDFISGIISNGKEPIVNGYKISGKAEEGGKASNFQTSEAAAYLEANGIAIFKDGKLTGWIENNKARGIVWILNKVKSTDINIDWNGKKDAITMAPIRSKTKISVKFKNEKPVIHISIEDEGWISEANTAIDLTDPKEIDKIDKLVEKEIQKQISASVKAVQKMKTDIFGFGERVHRANPKLWKKIQGNWNDRFAELEVQVKVDSYTRREGIRTKPFWSTMKK